MLGPAVSYSVSGSLSLAAVRGAGAQDARLGGSPTAYLTRGSGEESGRIGEDEDGTSCENGSENERGSCTGEEWSISALGLKPSVQHRA